MIKADSLSRLYQYFTAIIGYGVRKQYSFESIEEFVSYSETFRRLEQSDDSFLSQRTINQEIAVVYCLDAPVSDVVDSDTVLIWVGQAYMRLFFHFNKSIYYIFLYIPLGEMLQLYSLYHEMDWNQLFDLFTQKMSEVTLLRKLLNKKKLSVNKLAQLSNISEATINYYCLKDSNIYEARYAYIDAIALVLKVNTNLFLKKIHNYVDYGRYEVDKHDPIFRSFLGLYLASYFCGDINNRKYSYLVENNTFQFNENQLSVVWTESSRFANITESKNPAIIKIVEEHCEMIPFGFRKNYILVIFEYNQVSESVKAYKCLIDFGFDKIIIINQSNILCVYKNYWQSYISDSVNKMMIEKAKTKTAEIKQKI